METSKKIFISQPMSDKTNEEILSERASAVETLNKQFNDIEVLDSFFKNVPHEAKPVWFLGEAIKVLSNADMALFLGDWRKYRGCRTEHLICKEYDIPTYEINEVGDIVPVA